MAVVERLARRGEEDGLPVGREALDGVARRVPREALRHAACGRHDEDVDVAVQLGAEREERAVGAEGRARLRPRARRDPLDARCRRAGSSRRRSRRRRRRGRPRGPAASASSSARRAPRRAAGARRRGRPGDARRASGARERRRMRSLSGRGRRPATGDHRRGGPTRSPPRTSLGLRASASRRWPAFAANSVLCRAALGRGLVDAPSFTSVRLVSGALALALLVRVCRPAARRRRATSAPRRPSSPTRSPSPSPTEDPGGARGAPPLRRGPGHDGRARARRR